MPGYLSQLRDRPLGGETVLDALLAAAPVTAGVARSYLARFLFRGDDVSKPVRALSGGERSRLELALLGIGAVNLLLLDEPTNHLDIPAREALEAFLRESSATLIIVSHDRRLLESVCERLWVVDPARGDEGTALVAPFDGRYRAWRVAVTEGWTAATELARRAGGAHGGSTLGTVGAGRPVRAAPVGDRSTEPAHGSGSAIAVAAPSLTRLSKDAYRRERERVEGDLARLTERKLALEAGLGDPAVQANFVELRRLGSELADVDGAIVMAEDAWLALEERAPE
jgi:ATP-binding cassette subfamily F protein 3